MPDTDRCISCGEIIPEGLQICPFCESYLLHYANNRLAHSISNGPMYAVDYWRGYIDGVKDTVKTYKGRRFND